MAKPKDTHRISNELITLQPTDNITVLPPNSGVVGTFLEQTANMFKARAMRMNGLLRRIDESGTKNGSMLLRQRRNVWRRRNQLYRNNSRKKD